MELIAIKQKTVDGLEMGILEDGTPYLTGRGLAAACGVAPSAILGWLPRWDRDAVKGKDVLLRDLLRKHKYNVDDPIMYKGADANWVIPDSVAMAVLEYYAFVSKAKTDEALDSFRILAAGGLKAFIYASLGYTPSALPASWQVFHDRTLASTVPVGYFGVFHEMSSFVLEAIRNGLKLNEGTVPDISVGLIWAKHWRANGLASKFGASVKYKHYYPDYMKQSASNPQEANAFPEAAVGEFRKWMREVYLPEKFLAYLSRKTKAGHLTTSTKNRLVAVFAPKSLTTAVGRVQ